METIDKTYEELLNRAIEQLPEENIMSERFTIPESKIFPEGKTTVFENFMQVSDILRRDPDHFMKYLTRELGTAGKIDGLRSIFQGRFTHDQIDANIKSYVEEYVMCSECNRPDTNLEKVDRVLILKCSACGAHRPVKKRQTADHKPEITINEGEIYDVTIQAVGSKGDGIAKYDKFTIFVPGAQKGESLKIKIKKITGYLAFADRA